MTVASVVMAVNDVTVVSVLMAVNDVTTVSVVTVLLSLLIPVRAVTVVGIVMGAIVGGQCCGDWVGVLWYCWRCGGGE